jgi:hypothetical protein
MNRIVLVHVSHSSSPLIITVAYNLNIVYKLAYVSLP